MMQYGRGTRRLPTSRTTSSTGRPPHDDDAIASHAYRLIQMRQKAETASLADRLNNALAQLHAQKIAFEEERTELVGQLDKVKEENERLRVRNR